MRSAHFKHRKRIAIATMAVAALLLVPTLVERWREPVFEGRRVSAWFSDLTLGSSFGMPPDPKVIERMTTASTAFHRMDSNVVPFLLKKLQTPDAPLRERLILAGRKQPVIGFICKRMIPPSHTRRYAIYAFSNMGEQAEAAIPALLIALDRESDTNAAHNVVMALARVSGYDTSRANQPYVPADYTRERVLGHVRSRHPHLFPHEPNLIPIGTNTITAGVKLYNSHTKALSGEVLKVERAHEFENGEMEPGVYIRFTNGNEGWAVRREMKGTLIDANALKNRTRMD